MVRFLPDEKPELQHYDSWTVLAWCWAWSLSCNSYECSQMGSISIETPELHSLNETRWAPELLVAYHECARHTASSFAELWCANGIGHDASHYVALDSHHYCIHVTSVAASVSCFRFCFYSVAMPMPKQSVLRCNALLHIGAVQAVGCIFAAASVSREMSLMGLSDCFDAVYQTRLHEVPNALVACAAGLQVDCSLDARSSCRPVVWDILVTSHSSLIATLAKQEAGLDPHPWPMLAAKS